MALFPSSVVGAATLTTGALLIWVRRTRPLLRITRYRLPWPRLSRLYRVVHISDIHAGWTTPLALYREVTEAVHRAKPDLVVLTGDYVNVSRTFFSRVQGFVCGLPSPVVAVLGNHDHLVGGRASAQNLMDAGAHVLQNRSISVGDLTVVGVDDGFSGHDRVEEAFCGIASPREALVLTHFPPTAERIASIGGRLILSGHTHAGQIHVSDIWDQRLARLGRLGPYIRGMYTLEEGTLLYVNAGLGHAWRGMRVGDMCRPELAIFELYPAPEPSIGE
ncbi:MAG: metallophosphoesterase [Myxococcales bacterium]|nr:metallophosphoesterase [Myxococcales bacterium]